MSNQPDFTTQRNDSSIRFLLNGEWTIEAGRLIETASDRLVAAAAGARAVELDLTGVERLDTTGVWLLNRVRKRLGERGVAAQLEHQPPQYAPLFKEADWREFKDATPRRPNVLHTILEDVGVSLIEFIFDLYRGVSFLGRVIESMGRALVKPTTFRFASFVAGIENYGLRSVPIIFTINFLVGSVVAQQALFQLSSYGAQTFVVNLIGVLNLRELGVLLTAIMIAGRSGSSITAELGTMKMREEVDAITVMGLSPIDVLATPRILALIVCLPLLTFVADMASILGGMLVSWSYAGLMPDAFLSRLQNAVGVHTFLAGLIKAPFMALEIGVISAMEGLSVQGSAESLGRQVTAAVVKSIFMVFIVDGLFAIFFASIKF